MKFSERAGITSAEKEIQRESMDEPLRNTLWSALSGFYWDKFDKDKHDGVMGHRADYLSGSNMHSLFIALWLHYFKKPTDTMPSKFYDGLESLRDYFFNAKWYEVYDFIEFVKDHSLEEQAEKFVSFCNKVLERENSAYRFVDGKIAEITSEHEIQSIEKAIANSTPYYGVKEHLSNALRLMSEREKPDYRNSIKESVSAIESLCKFISGDQDATLNPALRALEKNGKLHPALKKAFSSLYGYTNDADGIRHALMEESNVGKADAMFMLVSCSAFINLVISADDNDA